jgi:hypothetical protein
MVKCIGLRSIPDDTEVESAPRDADDEGHGLSAVAAGALRALATVAVR